MRESAIQSFRESARMKSVGWPTLALLMTAACRQSPAPAPAQTSIPPAQSQSTSRAAPPPDKTTSSGAVNVFDTVFGRPAAASRPLPAGLVIGGDCPPIEDDAEAEIAAQAAAPVPLIEGLTLTDLWKRNPNEEFECLTQVTKVDREGIDISVACTSPDTPGLTKHRICRSD